MLGASPFGVPVSGRVQVKTFLPAVMLGRGVMSRSNTELSSGSTWYFFASFQNNACISLSLAGYLAATSSAWVQSFLRSYSSQGYSVGFSFGGRFSQGARMTFVLAIQPSW